ncbi:hypothetical protein FRACYDRAFT_233354 [Fragilariopsis cylindrus CCMP1102]|uniref:Diaminopimelate epimerase-like protein n=1 Tax=Fragilariopsis cylindrus CCMP1102 TaxID=635003 RepID=A0A1E7FYH5_9STRA|nr:hypothetical protein FRACYDRAFT_233354 [Fragilariopsis cylindrus CCMP1102]|eukprot:OEU23184.1 hypothetical protein FRACYDRAFT_233354 [Fragilariopsis cylindrus CCMP1102]
MTTVTTTNFVRRAMVSAARTRKSTTTATATVVKSTAVVSVEKITARVFCLGGEGGNPVTIFASQHTLPGSVQRSLAKTCQWESVILTTNDDVSSNNTAAASSSSSALPSMTFYMPSGEEVSFCAHAAIGLAMGYQQIIPRRKQKQEIININEHSSSSLVFQASMTGESFKIDVGIIDDDDNDNDKDNQTDDDVIATVDATTRSESTNPSMCRLYMTSQFQEQTLSLDGQKTLKEWSDKLNWSTFLSSSSSSSSSNDKENVNVSWRNTSIARPKTLIQLDSIEAVHRAIPPPLPTYDTTTSPSSSSLSQTPQQQQNSNASTTTTTNFAEACNIMDDSTGIYVYAPRRYPQQQKQQSNTNSTSENNRSNIYFECRQFPRSSGYQEDPATGIAAAALAASLHFDNDNDNGNDTNNACTNSIASYDIYQGTAMGRPSLIQVVDLRREENEEEEKNSDTSDSARKNKIKNINKDFRISFGLQGKVEIDDRCTIEVLCNDDDDDNGQ